MNFSNYANQIGAIRVISGRCSPSYLRIQSMIVKDAFVFLIPLLILTLGAFALGMPLTAIFLLLLSAFVAFFFPESAAHDTRRSENNCFARRTVAS